MGRVFRPYYTRAAGDGSRERVHVKCWYAEYVDATGRQRRAKGFADKALTVQLLARLEREAARVRSGMLPAGATRAAEPLSAVLADWLAALAADDRTERYREAAGGYVRAAAAACRWRTFADVDGDRLAGWLKRRRDGGLSPASSNTALTRVKSFARWAAGRCGFAASPLAEVRRALEGADLRRSRRVLAPAELAALVAAAERAASRRGDMGGPDRAMLYRVAAHTGFRASELASFTPRSFDLSAGTLTIAAKDAKGRREEAVPLPAHLVGLLRPWLAGRPPRERVWPGRWAADRRQGRWLAADVRRAGIARTDADGQTVHFHSIRAYYVTALVEAGANAAELQELARHRNIATTMRHYARTRPAALRALADRLPALASPCVDTCPQGALPVPSPAAGEAKEKGRKRLESKGKRQKPK